MNRSRRIAAIVIAGVIGGTGTYFYLSFMAPGIAMAREVKQAKIRLLCETDHEALLKACRELSQRYVRGELDGNEPIESSPQLPEVIRALRPNHVTLSRNGVVKIGMYTGWWPFGVCAYPEGREKSSSEYGDRELLKGLWYYEDGYSLHPDAYDKRINELLSKNTKPGRATPRASTGSH